MTKKIVFGAALALVIVGLMAPNASAVCAGSKGVSTYNGGTGAFSYWHTTLPVAGATLVAKVWQPGGADVTGTCNTTAANPNHSILYFGATPGDIGMSYDLSDSCVQPQSACAVGQVAVLATITSGGQSQFLTTQAPENASSSTTFDFSGFGNHAMVAYPRPRITASSRAGSTVTASVSLDPVSAGSYEGSSGLITGYNILSKLSQNDPGRNASAYDAGPNVAASNGGPGSAVVPVDCTGSNATLARRWVVTQLVTANGPAPTVSQATVVGCDPSLADPKFKIVPKPRIEPNAKAKH